MEITIKLTGEDLLNYPDAVKALTTIASCKNVPPAIVEGTPPSSALENATVAAPIVPAPMPQKPTPMTAIPLSQNSIPAAVPTALGATQTTPIAAPTTPVAAYTLEQLSLAAAPLMDAGKTEALVALLQSFGVQTLQQLPHEKYNDFAVAIRGMGAQI